MKRLLGLNTEAVDCLNETWDTNTVFRIATESRDAEILYVTSNCPEEKVQEIVDAWYNDNETSELAHLPIEEVFESFGYIAVCANKLSAKIY